MALVRFNRRPSRVGFPGFAGKTFPALDDVESRIGRFMEGALTDPFGAAAFAEPIDWIPAMDIIETPTELTLSAELPGLDQKDVDVSVEDGVLTISGEKTEERKEEEDKKVYLYERSYGSFQRSFSLPANVDAGKIAADFQKGVLKVHLPKGKAEKPKGRKIEVKSA